MKRKIFYMMVVTFLTVFYASACSNVSVEDNGITTSEAKEIIDDAIPKAMEVYEIFYAGLMLDEGGNISLPVEDESRYCLVISDKYKNTDDLRETALEIFTPEFSEREFFSPYFNEPKDEEDVLYRPKYKDIDGLLHGNINSGGKGWGIKWLTETLTIIEQNEDTLLVEMNVTLFDNPDGKKTLELKYNGEKWLLNSSVLQ